MTKKTPEEKAEIERKQRENVRKKLAKENMPKPLIPKNQRPKAPIKRNPLLKKPTKNNPNPTLKKTGSLIPRGKPLIPKGKNLLQMLAQPTEEEITEVLEHRKQVRRIRNFIRRAQARGYEFFETPDFDNLSSEDLKNIKSNDLYKYANFHDEQSGETFTGEQGRRIEKYRQTLKARQAKLEKEQAEQEEYERIRKEYEKLEQEQKSKEQVEYEDKVTDILSDMKNEKQRKDSPDFQKKRRELAHLFTEPLSDEFLANVKSFIEDDEELEQLDYSEIKQAKASNNFEDFFAKEQERDYINKYKSIGELLEETNFVNENKQFMESINEPVDKQIFAIIDDILESIPPYRMYGKYIIKLRWAKDRAIELWKNTVRKYEDNYGSESTQKLMEYLEDNQVAQQLMYWTSDVLLKPSIVPEEVNTAINHILEILNDGYALSIDDQKEFENFNEIY